LKPPQGPENVDTPTVKQPNGDPIFSDYADVFTGLGDLPSQVHIQLTPMQYQELMLVDEYLFHFSNKLKMN
jgi:hypothetical protein